MLQKQVREMTSKRNIKGGETARKAVAFLMRRLDQVSYVLSLTHSKQRLMMIHASILAENLRPSFKFETKTYLFFENVKYYPKKGFFLQPITTENRLT